ncbi:dTDP-4-dehydrorhamnose reductase [Clostridiales bacterium PH28_bin88]|nr:dTDP-4-dehydrorhamnose reductase [Clostridiales bacterium PH28_bin88]
MKVLVTGAGGQLGQELALLLKSEGKREVVALGRQELDVTRPESQQVIREIKPRVVIHTGANTDVDGCEKDPESAFRVNTLGTRNVAVACRDAGSKLVYLSTDYVFNGQQRVPYNEFDPTEPVNVYGRSKLAGEHYVTSLAERYFIVRTSWLYGRYGGNFVNTMLKLGREQKELAVVNDQVGSPTYTLDLARVILELMDTELYGFYHACNGGNCSWFVFAKTIFQLAGMDVNVKPTSTAELGRPAPRPAFSAMDNLCLRLEGLEPLPPWQDALGRYLASLDLKG